MIKYKQLLLTSLLSTILCCQVFGSHIDGSIGESSSYNSSSSSSTVSDPVPQSSVYYLPFETLPEETQLHILSFIEKTEVTAINRTSHHLQRLMQDEILWHVICIRHRVIDDKSDQPKYFPDMTFQEIFKLHSKLEFIDLDITANDKLYHCKMSADGKIIAAKSYREPRNTQLVLLNYRNYGIRYIERLPEQTLCHFDSMSATGRFIVGNAPNHERNTAFIIREETGERTFLVGYNQNDETRANAISFDGSLIVGSHRSPDRTLGKIAVTWSFAEGQTPTLSSLGKLNGGMWSEAMAVSENNDIIAGNANDGFDNLNKSFKYTKQSGMQVLPLLNNGSCSHARTISLNSKFIIGDAMDGRNGKMTAVRWFEESGILTVQSLTNLDPSEVYSSAICISANGRIVGLNIEKTLPIVLVWACLWTETLGLRSLNDIVANQLECQDIHFRSINAMSPNGLILTGHAQRDGKDFAYKLTLPSKYFD